MLMRTMKRQRDKIENKKSWAEPNWDMVCCNHKGLSEFRFLGMKEAEHVYLICKLKHSFHVSTKSSPYSEIAGNKSTWNNSFERGQEIWNQLRFPQALFCLSGPEDNSLQDHLLVQNSSSHRPELSHGHQKLLEQNCSVHMFPWRKWARFQDTSPCGHVVCLWGVCADREMLKCSTISFGSSNCCVGQTCQTHEDPLAGKA